MSNTRCFTQKAPQQGPPLFQHGSLVFQGLDLYQLLSQYWQLLIIFRISSSCMNNSTYYNFVFFLRLPQVGWLVTGFFTIIATVTSFWLINKHLQWYTNVCKPSLCLLTGLTLKLLLETRTTLYVETLSIWVMVGVLTAYLSRYRPSIIHGAYICDH